MQIALGMESIDTSHAGCAVVENSRLVVGHSIWGVAKP